MQLYTIALYLMIFNLSLGLVSSTTLFNTNTGGAPIYVGNSSQVIGEGNLSGTAPNLPTDDNNIFAQIVSFAQLMWQYLTTLPHLLRSIGMVEPFPSIIGYMVNFIYIIGIIQFVTGRWISFAK